MSKKGCNVVCEICGVVEGDLKRFANHLNSIHKLSSIEYTIKFLCNGVRPICLECGEETRYVSFKFKEYCKEHGLIKMSKSGGIGGKAPAWNRGKTKETDTRLMTYSNKVKGTNNHFWGRRHNRETIEQISRKKRLGDSTLEERIEKRKEDFRLITPLDEYESRQRQYLEFECRKCNSTQKKTLQAFERGSLCEVCHPNNHSKWELEVYDFVRSLVNNVKLGDRTSIKPKEIDVFIEDKALGIECHGLYFHSGDDISKHAHSLKAELTKDVGINLLQVFWDEWRDKRRIVESMIKYRLGIVKEKLGARNCEVLELSSKQQKDFFNASHISGWVAAKKCWGLIHKDEIVAAISIRNPRQKKWNGYLEVARYAQKNDIVVNGALSRLVKVAEEYSKNNGYEGLMTYVDRRIGTGSGYKKSGFDFVSKTREDYWYTDGTCRYDRFKFRARDGKSEAQIAKENKMEKIYGAGNFVYLKRF